MVPEVAVSPQNPEAQPIRTGSVLVDSLELLSVCSFNFEERKRKNKPLNGRLSHFSKRILHHRSRKCCLCKWAIGDIVKKALNGEKKKKKALNGEKHQLM